MGPQGKPGSTTPYYPAPAMVKDFDSNSYQGYSYGPQQQYQYRAAAGYYPPYKTGKQTFRKRVPGKDPDYAKKNYSHLERINPSDFSMEIPAARFFTIKSYSEDDVHKSMKYQVWSSTPDGNKRLNDAYKKCVAEKIPLYLFFSVNGSGQFVGVCKMLSEVNFDEKFAQWEQEDKWPGKFRVEWVFIKDIPNREFKSILVPTNENKPVSNCRDSMELALSEGLKVLEIFKNYVSHTCLLDEFAAYDEAERKKKEEKPAPVESFGRFTHEQSRRRTGRAMRGSTGGRGGRYQPWKGAEAEEKKDTAEKKEETKKEG